ncbi:hypothetical protein ES703_78605 [subsurface metagenome]
MLDQWQPTQKSRRCYHRVISGIERGGQLRFLTLTSSNESPVSCQRDFRALYMRLKRRGLMEGYIKVPELSKNGKQHLHVLFRGNYIDQKLISVWWQELHQAKVVDIRKVRYSNRKKHLAAYMAKYMSKENLYRYSWNWNWVWRGFVKDWEALKRWWHQYNALAGYHSFGWLLNQWKICLNYGLKPKLAPLPELP